MPRFIALLRGINVGGHNRVPMLELRSLCTGLGWDDVETYIQSGNVLFSARGKGRRMEAAVEQAIERSFGLTIPVLVRSAAEWSKYVAGNPFPEASEQEPNKVMLALSKLPIADQAEETLQGRAAELERVTRVGDALWIYYGGGAARTKLTPAVLDRISGSPVTTRNWRTVLKLAELAGASVPDV